MSLSKYILLFFVLSICLSIGSAIHVILGKTAQIDCYDPEVAQQQSDFYVEVKFKPSISGALESKILWYKPSQKRFEWFDSSYQGFVTIRQSGILEKEHVGLTDEGTFACVSKGFGISNPVKETVIIILNPPLVDVRVITYPLVVGNEMIDVAECSAREGKPAALVNWIPDDSHLEFVQDKSNFSSSSLTSVTSILQLKPFKSYNKQSFHCEIKHAAFEKTNITIITLNVTYPPEHPQIFLSEDKSVLTCLADSNPPPVYEWTMPVGMKPPKMFGPSIEIKTQLDSYHQNDTYTCVASNAAGRSAPVNITSYEASVAKASTNMWLYIGIGISAFFVVALLIYVYCRFTKSREEKKMHYPKQDYLIRHNTDRYMIPPIQHPNDSLHRPPSPVRPPPDDYDYDDSDAEEYDVEMGSDYSRENSCHSGSKIGMTGASVVSFKPCWKPVANKKQRHPPSVARSHRSKETKFSPYEPEVIPDQPLSKHRPQYDYPPSDIDYSDEDTPRKAPQRFDSLSDYETRSYRSDRSSKKGKMKPIQYTEI